MKKRKKILIGLLLIGLSGATSLQAQETIPATGGVAIGSGGAASYSVGQLVYTTNEGANGSVAQGVQQPFEISVVTGIKEAKGISLSVSAYPNPTNDYLTIKVDNYKTANLQYMVYDINGKLLQTVNCTGNETSINIQDYPVSNYFVKIFDSEKAIKTFKIIKN